jgi:hypothetical protein
VFQSALFNPMFFVSVNAEVKTSDLIGLCGFLGPGILLYSHPVMNKAIQSISIENLLSITKTYRLIYKVDSKAIFTPLNYKIKPDFYLILLLQIKK